MADVDIKAVEELSERLWTDFQTAKLNAGSTGDPVLFFPDLDAEELELLRVSFEDQVGSGISWIASSFTDIWGVGGLDFLVLAAYARYASRTGIAFWDGFSEWVTGRTDHVSEVRDYGSLRFFMERHGVHLPRQKGRRRYVNGIGVAVRMSSRYTLRIGRVLARNVARYPFHLDDELLDETISDFLSEVRDRSPVAYGNGEDQDDEEGVELTGQVSFNSIESMFLHLPKSYMEASVRDRAGVLEDTKALYRIVESLVLDEKNRGPRDVIGGTTLWYLGSNIDELAAEIRSQDLTIARRDSAAHPRFRGFRSPVIFLDLAEYRVCLVVPEQRLDGFDADTVSLSVASPTVPELNEIKADLPVFSAGGVLRLSEELILPLPRFAPDIEVRIDDAPGRRFTGISGTYVLLNSDGLPFRGVPTADQDAFVLVPFETKLEWAGAIVEHERRDEGWTLYHLYLEKDTVFFLDGVPVAPCSPQVPAFSVSSDYLVGGCRLCGEDGHTRDLPVYREIPSLACRVSGETRVPDDLTLIINGAKTQYIVRGDVPVQDGTGDRRVEIFPSRFAIQAENGEYHGLLVDNHTNPGGYAFDFGFLHNLLYKFTKPLALPNVKVRVGELSFDNCSSVFDGNYEFPMNNDNLKFRLRFGSEKNRLVLQPPEVDWSYADGEAVPEKVHLRSIGNKVLTVRYSGGTCRVAARNGRSWHFLSHRSEGDGKISVSLLQLQGYKDESFEIVIRFRSHSSLETEPEWVTVMTVYTDFGLTIEPVYVFDDGAGVFVLPGGPGHYVRCGAVGHPDCEYSIDVLEEGGSMLVVPFVADGKEHTNLIAKDLGPGRFRFAIRSHVVHMGMTEPTVETVYEGAEFPVGIVRAPDTYGLLGKTLECMEAQVSVIDKRLRRRGSRRYDVKNFFLDVNRMSSNPDLPYEAIGYFWLNGRKVTHTDYVPYRVKIVERNDDRLVIHVVDADGQKLSIDEHHHINSRDTTTKARAAVFLAQIVTEE